MLLKNNNIQIANTKKIVLFLYAILAWFGLEPYFLINNDLIIIVILYSSFVLVLVFVDMSKKARDMLFFVLFFFIGFYFSVPGIGSINKNIGLAFIPTSIFFLIRKEYKIFLLKYFKTIFVLSLILGFVVYIFDVAGFNVPYSFIKSYTYISGYSLDYIGFMGNMKPIMFEPFNIYRFQGMYPEPGLVGTVTAMLLVLSNYRIKERQNLVLFICGTISLSLAFYIIGVFYYILRTKKGFSNILIGMLLLFIVFNIPATKYFIVNRFKIVNYKMKALNRVSDDFAVLYNQRIKNGDLDRKLFGYGADAHISPGYNVSSYKCIVYNKGYIGLFVIISFYILYLLKYLKDKVSRLMMIIILSSIYQRPDVMALFYAIIIVGGVAYLSNSVAERNSVNAYNLRT